MKNPNISLNSGRNASTRQGRATTPKTMFSRETAVRIEIKPHPGIVWTLLTQVSDYPGWNSTITSLDGMISLGEKSILRSALDANRTSKLRVKVVDPEKRLVGGDGLGSRVYVIIQNTNGTVTFSMTEKIGGPIFPLDAKMIPSFDSSFEQFADDLKEEAESIMNFK